MAYPWAKPLLDDGDDGDVLEDVPGLVNDLVEELRTAVDAGGGGGSSYTPPVTRIRTIISAEESAQILDLTGGDTYTVGDNSLKLFLNGVRLVVDVDYTETSATRITFTGTAIKTGQKLILDGIIAA